MAAAMDGGGSLIYLLNTAKKHTSDIMFSCELEIGWPYKCMGLCMDIFLQVDTEISWFQFLILYYTRIQIMGGTLEAKHAAFHILSIIVYVYT